MIEGVGSNFAFEAMQNGRLAKVKLWFRDEAAAARFYELFLAGARAGRINLSLAGVELKVDAALEPLAKPVQLTLGAA